jgi:cyclomaltodextrinase
VEVYTDNGAQYACYIASDSTPEWTRQAIIYQIFVDRFFPGQGKHWKKPDWPSGFYGGTLRGITEKLDYIAKLGANVLWLTPIFPSPSHHGYDATDYFEIEPRLGTKADLCELLEAAHGRGMRVLLDFVPNHWSWLHRTFQQAVSDPDSPYRDWYLFTEWPEKYETFFGVRELPQVNLNYPAAREHMLEAAAYWLKLGVDGYRVDYAAGPAPEFWAYFRRATRLARLDSWSFGEVVEPPDSQVNFEGGLDGCLDFNLLEAFRQAFAFGRWDAQRLASFIARHEAFLRPSFLDNHDMNRFLWAAGNDKRRLKLAALCQFTLAGAPVIYYGTEVGLSQERDVRQDGRGLPEESRLPMLWGQAQDADLLDYYRSLVSLRKKHPALCRGTCDFLRVDGDSAQNVLAYRRGELLVMLNVSNGEQRLELDMKELKGEVLLQANGSVPITNGDTLVVRLPPLSGVVIR